MENFLLLQAWVEFYKYEWNWNYSFLETFHLWELVKSCFLKTTNISNICFNLFYYISLFKIINLVYYCSLERKVMWRRLIFRIFFHYFDIAAMRRRIIDSITTNKYTKILSFEDANINNNWIAIINLQNK